MSKKNNKRFSDDNDCFEDYQKESRRMTPKQLRQLQKLQEEADAFQERQQQNYYRNDR